MKKISTLLISISILSVSIFTANANTTHQDDLIQVQEKLIKTYNLVSKLSIKEWQEKLLELSNNYSELGEKDKAEALESMSGAEFQEEILLILKENINSISENGILLIPVLIWWAVTPNGQTEGDMAKYLAGFALIVCSLGDMQQPSEI